MKKLGKSILKKSTPPLRPKPTIVEKESKIERDSSEIHQTTKTEEEIKTRKSEAARKGWDKRTRNEGKQQALEGVAGLSNPVASAALDMKDVMLGSAKTLVPRKYRKIRRKLADQIRTI